MHIRFTRLQIYACVINVASPAESERRLSWFCYLLKVVENRVVTLKLIFYLTQDFTRSTQRKNFEVE